MYYTLGQRQGLGIGGRRDGAGDPWYVAGKDIATNTLTVVQGHDHPLLLQRTLAAGGRELDRAATPPRAGADLARQDALPPGRCRVRAARRGRRRRFELDFAAPQWAVTPGQSAVLYRGEVCLGGGVIR